jgi:anti-sigma regulatory factor (Ser/Thr protein kinase)
VTQQTITHGSHETLTTLPPLGSSPSTARRVVQSAIGDGALGAVLDEALLLVTELVTNAVVHAGTDIELRVEVRGERLRVEVVDRTPGLLHVDSHAPSDHREGGRGLLLLDALATEWGTRHFGWGKSVWFSLEASGASAAGAEGAPPRGVVQDAAQAATQDATRDLEGQRPADPLARRRDVDWLVGLEPDVEQRLSPQQIIAELLHRLSDALEINGSWLFAQSADDVRQWELVTVTDPTAPPPPIEQVRRAALGRGSVTASGLLMLGLHDTSGVFAALALDGGARLDAGDVALARLVGERIAIILREDRARASQLRSRGSLALLAEASEMFAGTLDVQLGMTLATQLVVPRFARWSAAWATDERVPRLMAVAHADEAKLPMLQEVLGDADGELLALRLARDLGARRPNLLPGSELPPELAEERSGEVLALPLVARRRLVGALLVGRPPGGIFGPDDVSLLNDLARRTAVAVDSARLYEESTTIAHALQASLLPRTLPTSPVCEFAARYAAAGEGNEVGGDFYDVFDLPDGGWGLAIGDVCGKGAEAASITGLARNVLRLLVRDGARPPVALRRLNDAILELGERGRFCTALLGTIETEGSRLRLTLSGAGHPLAALLRANGGVQFVGRSGTLLGVMPQIDLTEDFLTLEPGDALVFYTDGVTERRNGPAMFGDENLLSCLREMAGANADDIAGQMEASVQRFGPARDDLAVLVVRCTDVVAG